MAFRIVTDSSCGLSDSFLREHDLHVLPLTYMVDGEQYPCYVPGKEFDGPAFYDLLRDGKEITTSLPNMNESVTILRELAQAGDDLLYIGFSSALSGTCQCISLIMSQLSVEFPEQRFYAVDTLGASLGEGLLVYYAVEMAEKGSSIEEVRDWVEENKLHLAHWFTVDDLMYLFRGGRVTKSSAYAGTLLNIKPILHMDDTGHLIPMAKIRGRKKSLISLVDHMDNALEPVEDQKIFIVHSDCADEAAFVADRIKKIFGCADIELGFLDPVIGAHCGPGTIGLFWLAEKR